MLRADPAVTATCMEEIPLQAPLGLRFWNKHPGFSTRLRQKQSCLTRHTHTHTDTLNSGVKPAEVSSGLVNVHERITLNQSFHHLFLLLVASVRRRCW